LDLSISLKKATDILKSGGCVGIFPEGMRAKEGDIKTGMGKMQQGKRGVAFLARETGAPIVPVALFGVWRVLNFWRVVSRQRQIKIIFGKPVTIGKEESLESGADKIMRNIQNLLEIHSVSPGK
jgi:1-acyl-sn-glycerol-3-phosphate acyltransferase